MARLEKRSAVVVLALVVLGAAAALGGACNALTGVGPLEIGTGGETGSGAHAGTAPHGGSGGSAGHAGAAGGQAGSGATGGQGGSANSCAGQSCSGFGTCELGDGGVAQCNCQLGYHDEGLSCVVDPPCDLQCGYCTAGCKVLDGVPQCTCDVGWTLTGVDCFPSPGPCDNVPCDPGFTCVPAHHCMIDPLCVETCDCSNCGTCSMQDFANSGTQVLYCGSGEQSPPTAACTDPCPSGSGCIPYDPPICWGGQGCMSL